jgi:hypothetical protein
MDNISLTNYLLLTVYFTCGSNRLNGGYFTTDVTFLPTRKPPTRRKQCKMSEIITAPSIEEMTVIPDQEMEIYEALSQIQTELLSKKPKNITKHWYESITKVLLAYRRDALKQLTKDLYASRNIEKSIEDCNNGRLILNRVDELLDDTIPLFFQYWSQNGCVR